MFIHTHAHSSYSIADGLFSPKQWAKALKDRGFKGHTLTDHGTMAGLLPFYHAMKEEKLTPLMGVEFYFVDDPTIKNETNRTASHLILIAKDEEGWRNLLALSHLSYTEGFYYRPRVGVEWLSKHSGGLICLTACLGGVLSREIWKARDNKPTLGVVERFKQFKAMFGDDFYVEFQSHDADDQRLINGELKKLEKQKGFKPVASNDCHYLNQEHAPVQTLIKASAFKNTEAAASYTHFDSLWLKKPKDVFESFSEHHDLDKRFIVTAMQSTQEIFEKCVNFELPKKKYLPRYSEDTSLFKTLTMKKLKEFLDKKDFSFGSRDDYVARFKKEFGVITKYGLQDYFLLVWDIVEYARSKGIVVGIGRGCLHPDTLIVTSTGIKKISEVVVGDSVINRHGEYKNVNKVFKYDVSENCIRIKARFGVTEGEMFTSDHKILCIKTKLNAYKTYEDVSDPEWIPAKEVKRGYRVFTPIVEDRDDFDIDDDLLWLFGYWVGDGWLTKHKKIIRRDTGWSSSTGFNVGFAFNNSTKKCSYERAVEILKGIGLNPRSVSHRTKNVIQVTVSNKDFYQKMIDIFPDYSSSNSKHFPVFFRRLSKRQQLIMLSGLIDADGSRAASKTVLCTTSKRLAYEVKEICVSIGDICSLRSEPARIDKRGYNSSDAYYLIIDNVKNKTTKTHTGGVWSLVRDVTTEPYNGNVFDLSVDGSEKNFLTASFLVHNSSAGSFICHLLGIVKINPLQYGLLFERFLNEVRCEFGELPDIDLDFESLKRQIIKDYILERYGRDKVCEIGTYGRMMLKTAIIDFGKQFGIEQRELLQITTGLDLDKTETQSLDAALSDSPRLKSIMDSHESYGPAVRAVIGQIKSQSIHPAGVIICSEPIAGVTPLKTQKPSGKNTERSVVTQAEDKQVIAQGLVKMDILGLKEYDIFRMILETADTDLTIDNYVDVIHDAETREPNQAVWDMFKRGETDAVFQFSGSGMKQLLIDMKADSLADLIAAVALYRPGCLENDWHTLYYRRKHGEESVEYLHPILEEILKDTFGVCISKGSMVLTSTGEKPIEDVCVGDLVKTETGDFRPVLRNINNGSRDTVVVRMSNGEELICTPDHKIMTSDGWVMAGDLIKGDMVKSFWVSEQKHRLGDDRDWLIGLAIADGGMTGSPVEIACCDRNFAERVAQIAVNAYGLSPRIYWHTRCWYVSMTGSKSGFYNRNPFYADLKRLNLYGKNGRNKRLPADCSLSMLAGFVEGDGCMTSGRIRIKNNSLARDLYRAFHSFRIPAAFFKDIDGADTVSFSDYLCLLPFRIKSLKHPARAYLPRSYMPKLPRDNDDRQHVYRKAKFISKSTVDRYRTDYEHDLWSKVLSVRPGSTCVVYDLEVDDIHSFVAGGHVVHNCIFQEQFMEIFHKLGMIPLIEADIIRSALGKKDEEKLEKFKKKFVKGASNHISSHDASELWEQLKKAAGYTFNKSHSAVYAIVAYISQYFKVTHPLEYWTAVIDWNCRKKEKDLLLNKKAAQAQGIVFQMPDINLSGPTFTIKDGRSVWSFVGVAGIGEKTAEKIAEGQPYASVDDFLKRIRGVNFANKLSLVYAGAFDSLGDRVEAVKKIYATNKKKKCPKLTGAHLLYEFNAALGFFEDRLSTVYPGISKNCFTEKEVVETVAGEPVLCAGMVSMVKRIKTKKGDTMAKVHIVDSDEQFELTLFPSTWASNSTKLREGMIVQIAGYKSNFGGKHQIEVDEVELIE